MAGDLEGRRVEAIWSAIDGVPYDVPGKLFVALGVLGLSFLMALAVCCVPVREF